MTDEPFKHSRINQYLHHYAFQYDDVDIGLLCLVIPDRLPPSLNDLIAKSYQWSLKQRRWFQFFISKNCKEIPTVSHQKRNVRIDLFKSTLDDEPNLDARSKIILDSMKQESLIFDDSPKYLGWARVHQWKHSPSATVISITETADVPLLKELEGFPVHALIETAKDF